MTPGMRVRAVNDAPIAAGGRYVLYWMIAARRDFPCFFLPRMVASAGRRLAVRLEAVDGTGLLPMSAADRVFPTAFAMRRHLQQVLAAHIGAIPDPAPIARPSPGERPALPAGVAER
jgi:deoxyribodipyrimidine photo-lyase